MTTKRSEGELTGIGKHNLKKNPALILHQGMACIISVLISRIISLFSLYLDGEMTDNKINNCFPDPNYLVDNILISNRQIGLLSGSLAQRSGYLFNR